MNGDVPVVVRKLVGHVDNSSYTHVEVDIDLTLTTPAEAAGPVPVMLELSWVFPPNRRPPPGWTPPPGPTWQQQVLAKGWGYASYVPLSVQADDGKGLTKGIIGLVNKGRPRGLDDRGALRAWAWGASRALDYALPGKRGLGATQFPPTETALMDGDVAYRQHAGGHWPGPNWPTFINFAGRYLKAPAARPTPKQST